MKRSFLIVLCCVLAASAYADLHLLVGPSVLVDTQNEISGTALGLNVTLWGLVPKKPNLGFWAFLTPYCSCVPTAMYTTLRVEKIPSVSTPALASGMLPCFHGRYTSKHFSCS